MVQRRVTPQRYVNQLIGRVLSYNKIKNDMVVEKDGGDVGKTVHIKADVTIQSVYWKNKKEILLNPGSLDNNAWKMFVQIRKK